MGRRSEQIVFHRGNADGQQAHEKMLNINNHQRNTHPLTITRTYHLTPIKRAMIKKNTNNTCWRGCEEKGILLHCWSVSWCSHCEDCMEVSQKTKTELPRDLAIPFLGIYLKNKQTNKHTHHQKDVCSPVFTAALFTIASIQKQLQCPSIDEWVKKWHSQTGRQTDRYNGILLTHKNRNFAICSNMDGLL